MSETTDTAKAGEQPTEATEASGFEPIASQEDLDKIIQTRLARERSKYADYEDLKAKAAEYDKAVEANKTELEKAIERADKAEAQLRAATHAQERLEVIAEFQIPADLQELVTGESKDELISKAEKLVAVIKPVPNGHQVVSVDGKIPSRQPTSTAQMFADAVGEI